MAHQNVIDAMKGWLGDTWGPNAIPVSYPNDPNSSTRGGQTFIQVQFPAATRARHTMSPGVYTEDGGIRIVVNGQRGFGLDEVQPICDGIADQFRDKNLLGVRMWTPGTAVYDNGNDSGEYFQAAFVIPYTYHYRA